VVLQKSPLKAKATWRSHAIPDRWLEKVDRTTHPHVKPIGLINALIEAITIPGELVVESCRRQLRGPARRPSARP
jgi:site-specific DNA-methyltransferase (adenine-specific)